MTFAFNCSAPPAGVHFVPSPPVRGTLDIVWSCFGVLILSTWGVWPKSRIDTTDKPPPRTKRQKVQAYVEDSCEKSLLAIVALLAPELIASLTAYEWLRSRMIHKEGICYTAQDNVDWSLTKAYYANMNGFRIEFTNTLNGNDATVPPTGESSAGDVQELLTDTASVRGDPTTKPVYVTGEELLYLRSVGVLESLPSISTEEINDKDKSNGLLRTLALVQTSWLIIQIFVRYSEKLKVTQLEVVTLAFAILNLVTRIIDWHRPKDVHTATPIQAVRLPSSEEQSNLDTNALGGKYMGTYEDISTAVACVVGPLFGGLHCLAWHESFPTETEKILWRVCSLITTFLPLCAILWRYDFEITKLRYIGRASICIYSLTRLFIMVETGRSLFYQPPDTFISTWAANFPHLG